MNEEETLAEIFGEKRIWKEKYPISWCGLCDCAIISCPEPNCHGTSCNCGGCDKCDKAQRDFNKVKNIIEDYLTEEESKILEKARWIKKYMMESIALGEYEIDWIRMSRMGELSRNTQEIFAKEILAARAKEPDREWEYKG